MAKDVRMSDRTEELLRAAARFFDSVDDLIRENGYLPGNEALIAQRMIGNIKIVFVAWGEALEEEYQPWIEGKGRDDSLEPTSEG